MRQSHRYALILAGGVGTRLWPISRAHRPKQHLTLFGNTTLVASTYARALRIFQHRNIFIATHARELPVLKAQLPQLSTQQIIVEPEKRGTGAAIGFGLIHILARDPQARVATLNADAHISNARRYDRALTAAMDAVERYPSHLGIIGIAPRYPETGYGYIVAGKRVGASHGFPFFAVRRFQEKPEPRVAARLIASGRAWWNTTILVTTAAHLLTLYARHLPHTHRILLRIQSELAREAGRAPSRISRLFRQLPLSDINYDILERERSLFVLPARGVGWADIGNWRSVASVMGGRGVSGLLRSGPVISVDSDHLFVVSSAEKLVAAVGVDDVTIIDTPDALLVCSQQRAHDVKQVVRALQRRTLARYR